MKKYLIVILFLNLNFLSAQNSGLIFLERSNSVRSSAMGSTKIISNDFISTISNPSLLMNFQKNSSQVSYFILPFAASQNAFSLNLYKGNISSNLFFISHKINEIEIREKPGDLIGTTSLSDFALGTSIAYEIDSTFSVGVNLKFLHEKLFIDASTGYGIDFGIYKIFDNEIALAFTLNNFGEMDNFRNEKILLPSSISFATSKIFIFEEFKSITEIETDYFIKNKNTYFGIGNEIEYKNIFGRIGYQIGYNSRWFTFGFGAKLKNIQVDYSYQPLKNIIGEEHGISFLINF